MPGPPEGPAGGIAEAREPRRLRRAITGKLLFLFVLGDVLGAGIYALVGAVAGEVGGAVWLPMGIALGIALLTASSYAELVTKYPRAGGSTVYAERAYRSPFVSFMVGYCMLAAGVVSAAGLAHAFAGEYLSSLVDVPTTAATVLFLLALGALNARGIRESMRANVVMTCIEVSGLLIVLVAASHLVLGGEGDPARALDVSGDGAPASAVLAAAVLAFYSFVGFETSANVAEEIKDPSRVYPRALFAAILAAGLIYAAVGSAATMSVPPAELAESTGPLLTVVDASGIAFPDRLFSVVALIAVANGALLTMVMSSRLTYGMARQGLLPRPLAALLPERRTPWAAIVATTLVAVALTFVGDLPALAETVVLLLLFVFLSTNVAVVVLRRDEVDHPHFRTWLGFPVLATGSCLGLLTQQAGSVWARGAALIAVGIALFALSRLEARGRPRGVAEPGGAPAEAGDGA